MTPGNQPVVWIAGTWAVILAVGLSYYLIRSWKRGIIMTPTRVAKVVSRETNPFLYWFSMLIWLFFDLMAIGILLYRLYASLKPAA